MQKKLNISLKPWEITRKQAVGGNAWTQVGDMCWIYICVCLGVYIYMCIYGLSFYSFGTCRVRHMPPRRTHTLTIPDC